MSRRPSLAERRKALGFTQEALAEALGVERSTVARWEHGKSAPQPWVRLKLATVLRLHVEELQSLLSEADTSIHGNMWLRSRKGERSPGLDSEIELAVHMSPGEHRAVREVLDPMSSGIVNPPGMFASSHVTPDLVEDIRSISASLRRAYGAAPARRLYASAYEHLKLIVALRPGDQKPIVRVPLLGALGEMAVVCATILGLDMSRWSEACLYLRMARRMADEVGSAELASIVLTGRAFHAAYGSGDKRLGLDYAEAAIDVSRRGASNVTRGWVAAVASERRADMGDAMGSERLLDESRAALSCTPDVRSWSGIGEFNFAKIAAYEGGNYRRLGDYSNAVRSLDVALKNLNPGMRRHRTTALIDRAEAHLCAGTADAACADTGAALTLISQTEHGAGLDRAQRLVQALRKTRARDTDHLWQRVLDVRRATAVRCE